MSQTTHAAGAPSPGHRLTGPGKSLVFAAVTAEAVTFHEEIGTDALAVPVHIHSAQSERFTVLDGILAVTVAGVPSRLGAGETVLVPAGTAHTYANGGSTPLRIEVTLQPALEAAAFFDSVYALQRDARLPPRAFRDVLALAALSHRHGFYLAALPLAIQRPLMAAGARLARLFGTT